MRKLKVYAGEEGLARHRGQLGETAEAGA